MSQEMQDYVNGLAFEERPGFSKIEDYINDSNFLEQPKLMIQSMNQSMMNNYHDEELLLNDQVGESYEERQWWYDATIEEEHKYLDSLIQDELAKYKNIINKIKLRQRVAACAPITPIIEKECDGKCDAITSNQQKALFQKWKNTFTQMKVGQGEPHVKSTPKLKRIKWVERAKSLH